MAQRGAPRSEQTEHLYQALLLVAQNGFAADVERLLDTCSDLREWRTLSARLLRHSYRLHSAALEAAHTGHLGTVDSLLDRGASVNAQRGRVRHTPLAAVCEISGTLDTLSAARRLLQRGADASLASRGGWTPLLYACGGHGGRADVRLVRLLLEHGARADSSNGLYTPLHVAARYADIDVLAELLPRLSLSQLQTSTCFGECPLLVAAKHGRAGVVGLLVDTLVARGGTLNSRDRHGTTALSVVLSRVAPWHADAALWTHVVETMKGHGAMSD